MGKINSRAKGCRGEREWRDMLRAEGYEARRGQQFSGGTDSPDVICGDLPGLHFEVKLVQNLNVDRVMNEQAEPDAGDKIPVIAHRKNHSKWLVTLKAEDFFLILRNSDLESLSTPSNLRTCR